MLAEVRVIAVLTPRPLASVHRDLTSVLLSLRVCDARTA